MTPLAARRLVGQPDIVDAEHWLVCVAEGDREGLTINARSALRAAELRSEIENLRAVLRAVRASTDPEWAARLITYALREGEGTP
jgi:hypothetical protein